jgi:hypothetical protein
MLDFRFVVMIEKRRRASAIRQPPDAKVVSAVTVVNATTNKKKAKWLAKIVRTRLAVDL